MKAGFEEAEQGTAAAGERGRPEAGPGRGCFDGGVLIRGKSCDYDGSFATLLQDVRDQEEYRVAELLFGAEVK